MTTLPESLARLARERPANVVLRSKRHGLWRTLTYADLDRRVGEVSAGLAELGVASGAPVALIAENSPDWVVADLAIQSLGARSVALPPQTPTAVAARALAGSGAAVVICGDQEQVDLVIEAGEALEHVTAIVVIDRTGTERYDEPRLRMLADVEQAGTGRTAPAPDPDPAAAAVVMLSAGSCGDPSATPHAAGTAAALAAGAAGWLELAAKDRNLCVLPFATPGARIVDLYAALLAGTQISVPESPATVAADLVEVSPTVLCLSPRAVELLRQTSERRSRESSRLRRAAYRWAMGRLGGRLDRNAGARTVAGAARRRGLPYLLVGRWVAANLGMQRARRIVVTGGAVPARDARFFWSLGIPVLETYGQAELGGLAFAHSTLDDAGTIGRPLPGVASRIVDDGGLELTTAAAGDVWHATGDLAEDAGDGRVRVRGRRTDVVHAAGGDVVVAGLETALCDSAYIRRAVVAGLGDGGLTALVEVDLDETAPWAAARDIHFSTYVSLVSRPEVEELIAAEVAAANERLDTSALIAGFIVLPRQLSVRDGELTAHLSVRRSVVIEHFAGPDAGARSPARPRAPATAS